MKKFRRLVLVLPLIALYYFNLKQAVQLTNSPLAPSQTVSTHGVRTERARVPATIPSLNMKSPRPSRHLLALPKAQPPVDQLAPVPEDYVIVKDASVKVGENFLLVHELFALPKDQWQEEHGNIVHHDSHFTFFTPHTETSPGWPVAYDLVTRSFHPVSHILHISQVTKQIRRQLKNNGLTEYYYNQNLMLLSLESHPSSVLTHYRQLQARGLDVQLEVLRRLPYAK